VSANTTRDIHSVNTVTMLRAGRHVFNSWQRQRYFSSSRTSFGSHILLLSGYRGLSYPGSKLAGAWSWPHTSIRAEVKNAWSHTCTPTYIFMSWCL